MALNAKVRNLSDDFGGSLTTETPPSRWEFKFSLGRLITLWGVMAAMLLVVFLFGLYTGKQQGIKLALDSQSAALTVRLPVVPPQPSGVVNSAIPEIQQVTPAPAKESFDFSQSKVVEGEDTFVAVDSKPEAKAELPLVSLGSGSAGESLKRTEEATNTVSNQPPSTPPVELKRSEPAIVDTLATPKVAGEKKVAAEKPAAPKVESAPAPKKMAMKKGWVVQVSASDTRGEAAAIQRRLRSSGVDSDIQEARVNGVLYFRVLAGPYPDKNGADMARSKIAKTPGLSGKPFVRPLN